MAVLSIVVEVLVVVVVAPTLEVVLAVVAVIVVLSDDRKTTPAASLFVPALFPSAGPSLSRTIQIYDIAVTVAHTWPWQDSNLQSPAP